MKVNKKNFVHLMTASTTYIPRLDTSVRVPSERILGRVTPPTIPGVGILLHLTHTKEKVAQHLIAKWLVFGFLRKNERFVSQLLSVDLPIAMSEIQRFILSNEIRRSADRRALHRELLEFDPTLTPKSPKTYLFTFEPELLIHTVYVDKKRFPPKRFVGVGYTDQGTLSTGPAWQDQVRWDIEEECLVDELKILLSHFSLQLPSQGPYSSVSLTEEAK